MVTRYILQVKTRNFTFDFVQKSEDVYLLLDGYQLDQTTVKAIKEIEQYPLKLQKAGFEWNAYIKMDELSNEP